MSIGLLSSIRITKAVKENDIFQKLREVTRHQNFKAKGSVSSVGAELALSFPADGKFNPRTSPRQKFDGDLRVNQETRS